MKTNKEYVLREIAGEPLLIPTGMASQKLNGMIRLTETAAFIWKQVDIASDLEEIVERMAREGHLVGNHSYRHEPLTQAGLEQVCDSFARTGEMIWEITGIRPEYARPPYGDWNEELECRTELSTVLWDVDSLDWNYQDRKQIADKVCREIENGDIVLMHDIFQSSQEAALDIIDRLTAEGWQFVTADELMVD